MKSYKERLKGYLTNDLDLVILVGAAILLTVLGILGMKDDFLNPAIVALLGALAFSQLKSRDQVADVTATWHRSRTDLFLWNFPPEYKEAQRTVSHSYFFAGTTMNRTLPLMKDNIIRILRNDGRVRILLPDPNSKPLMEMIARTRPTRCADMIQKDIEYALASAKALRLPEKGQLEIRTVQFLPGIGINAMDLKHPSESIMVQVYEFAHNEQSERAPIFYLTAADGKWFSHFAAQIERLWDSGEDAFPDSASPRN